MRYYLEIGKRRNEFIISFIIAKDYFIFLLLQVSTTRNIRDFNKGKATVKVSLPFATYHELLYALPTLFGQSFV